METPDTLELHARARAKMPENWIVYHYQTLPEDSRERTHFELTGAICPTLYKSGPRKGQVNYKIREQQQTVIISIPEHDAWVLAWEAETGLCRDCGDSGRQIWGYSAAIGSTYRACRRCDRGTKVTL